MLPSKSKKGMFFTLIGILLLGTIVYSLQIKSSNHLREDVLVIENRIKTMNSFLTDVESDIKRGLFISGWRALYNEVIYITEVSGDFVNDSQELFSELILNGTIYGNTNNTDWVKDNTFINWTQKINNEANKLEIDIDFSNIIVNIYHSTPWDIAINLSTVVIMKDLRNPPAANWTTSINVVSILNIEEFPDPIYSVFSKGQSFNYITKEIDFDYVDLSSNDTTKLMNHTVNGYYVNSSFGPSYIMRLEGDFSGSPMGIESLVDAGKLAKKGINIYALNKSVVDYIFLNPLSANHTDNFLDGSLVVGVNYDWFKIDNNHINIYDLDGLTK